MIPPDLEEAERAAAIARRIHAGDADAERELVERYSQGLLYHLRQMTRDPSLADDLHQETFRVVLLRLRSGALEQPEKLAGFILRTGRNMALGDYRRHARRGDFAPAELPAEPPDPTPGQLDRVLRREAAEAVQQLIAELGSERDREILLRFHVAEEEKETICADLGLTTLQFNVVLFRARQRFKELVERSRQGRSPAARKRA
ncbi:MAG TPA: sigma-70 family RNA polymerase sigma factor [Thermoanaerobaculia bacterium]|jgi:RNA polymerase sigma-70 factor (ECF subfamily)